MRYSVATVVIAATFAATQPALAAPVASVPSTSAPSNNHDPGPSRGDPCPRRPVALPCLRLLKRTVPRALRGVAQPGGSARSSEGSAGQQNRRRGFELEFCGGGDVVQLVRAAARRRAVEQLYAQMDGMVDELYYARTYAMVEQLYVRTGAMLDEFD
ncbi:hypothetical protein EVJ58_g2446 [Rhodofomes roseus]|uniref:Uncharacterized protein n=1 Tax=Rhodofomes roseus TaxID=34475 RepID=A0A4Y9YRD0_9APHY|nr:hypothetical protein EVJ58_g2446 [Rhodofomes roseus]